MENKKFSLPGSSLDILKKIIQGYYKADKKCDLDSIAKLVRINRTTLSSNNKFLLEVGIIEGKRKKGITESGKKLGHAIEHNQQRDVREILGKIIQNNKFLSDLVTTVRIEVDKLTPEKFAEHILYASGLNKTKDNETGARTVMDILLSSELVNEVGGKIMVGKPSIEPEIEEALTEEAKEEEEKEDIKKKQETHGTQEIQKGNQPSIAINIQLQLPETENTQIYEDLFKALYDHLIKPSQPNPD